jgi:O-methyltransferase involved in polyketide biosynthesis
MREFLERYRRQFGGGMLPFDNAFFDALRNGKSTVEATQAGGHALLDAFVAQYEAEQRGEKVEWLDERGMPVEGPR